MTNIAVIKMRILTIATPNYSQRERARGVRGYTKSPSAGSRLSHNWESVNRMASQLGQTLTHLPPNRRPKHPSV